MATVHDNPLKLLRKEEAAEILAIHPRTLERLIAAGKLPVVRIAGRSVRVLADDVEKLIREGHEKR